MTLRRPELIQAFLLCLFIPLAILSLGRGIRNALSDTPPGRSTDLYPYWLGGYRLSLRQDPYREAIETDKVPVERAVTGVAARRPITNLPSMLLALAPLSVLAWPDARLLMAVVNMALALSIPWIAMRLVPTPLSIWTRWLIALAFYALLPTRNAIGNGQTSLLVVTLSLLALQLAPRNQLLAGVVLGFALSKFSVVLPILLWFVLFGWNKTYLVALTFQVTCLLGVAGMARATPWAVLEHYRKGLGLAAETYAGREDQFGTRALIEHLHLPEWLGYAAAAVLAVLALASLFRWRRAAWIRSTEKRLAAARATGHALAAAILLVLPIPLLFHAAYDGLGIVMAPVALLAAWPLVEASVRDGRLAFRRASVLVVLAWLAFMVPGTGSIPAGAIWTFLHPVILSGAALTILGVLIWLCQRYPWWIAQVNSD